MLTKNVKHIYGNGTEIDYIRIIADEGKAITDGTSKYNCVDVLSGDVSKWIEIDAPIVDDEEANEADYKAALAELGVTE